MTVVYQPGVGVFFYQISDSARLTVRREQIGLSGGNHTGQRAEKIKPTGAEIDDVLALRHLLGNPLRKAGNNLRIFTRADSLAVLHGNRGARLALV